MRRRRGGCVRFGLGATVPNRGLHLTAAPVALWAARGREAQPPVKPKPLGRSEALRRRLTSRLNMNEEVPKTVVTIRYKNYRGEIADRRIIPKAIRFASTQWHPEEQWLLDAYDLDKRADRSFAMKDILIWRG